MKNIKIIVERFFPDSSKNKKEEFVLPIKLGKCDISFMGSRSLFIDKIGEKVVFLSLRSLVLETESFKLLENSKVENTKHFSNFTEKITFIGE